MGRLFGTDGARGVANTELTCELAMAIGRAAAMVLIETAQRRPTVVIGKDTRASSDMLENALCAGLCSVGADVLLLGVIPTPAVAYLVSKYGADAGIMISASHNPCEYNGIKLFDGKGYKLPDTLEAEIEAIVLDGKKTPPTPIGGEVGRILPPRPAVDDYVYHLMGTTEIDLRGMKLAVDCANGSASATARKLFSALGADCVYINDQPDGTNINANCGSTHMEQLTELVKKMHFAAGVAFDGDADRCLAVDEKGNLLDGDKIIAALAYHMKEQGRLPGDTAVVTVMSNLGFFRFCEEKHIHTVSTKVGDRYVLEEMRREGYTLGGEQSGHIILSQFATTGDGQLSAIQLLTMARRRGWKLSRVGALMERYPQVMVNVRADAVQKQQFNDSKSLQAAVKAADESLGRDGRVLVRVSGTEPLVRVMVEGKDFDHINSIALELADTIKAALKKDEKDA